eukprot:1161192-Pelagomonas_calceolata.AAC.6
MQASSFVCHNLHLGASFPHPVPSSYCAALWECACTAHRSALTSAASTSLVFYRCSVTDCCCQTIAHLGAPCGRFIQNLLCLFGTHSWAMPILSQAHQQDGDRLLHVTIAILLHS